MWPPKPSRTLPPPQLSVPTQAASGSRLLPAHSRTASHLCSDFLQKPSAPAAPWCSVLHCRTETRGSCHDIHLGDTNAAVHQHWGVGEAEGWVSLLRPPQHLAQYTPSDRPAGNLECPWLLSSWTCWCELWRETEATAVSRLMNVRTC